MESVRNKLVFFAICHLNVLGVALSVRLKTKTELVMAKIALY